MTMDLNERIFYYFNELTKIPHGSRNQKQLSDWLVQFAKDHGLRWIQDEMNNVIIYKGRYRWSGKGGRGDSAGAYGHGLREGSGRGF